MPGLELPPAALDLFGSDLLLPIAGAAAILATLGLLLLLPLYFTQRREVVRLLDWMEREPERGEGGATGTSTVEATAATATAAPPGRAPTVPATGSSGQMTPAERVTSDRPALARITTAEQAAIEAAPPWRRILIRGPRHPLVLAIAALLVAALIFGAFVTFLRPAENESAGKGVDRASVSVVVVNASSSSGLADDVANGVEAGDFIVAGTDVAAETSNQSVVQYAQGSKRAAQSVAKRLKIGVVQPFDPESEAASLEADGADVVVIAGEDRARDLAGGG